MKSMTGFGYAEGMGELGFYQVYLKSVNHRFLEINLRLPRELLGWEEKINAALRKIASRGKLELRIDFEPREEAFTIEVNTALAQAYLEALKKLSVELSLPCEPRLELLLQVGEFIHLKKGESIWGKEWNSFAPIFEAALANFLTYREAEGEKLREDLLTQLEELERLVQEVEKEAGKIQEYYREKLSQRIREAMPQTKIDELVLAQELIFYVDRSDINEEVVRLKAHISRAKKVLIAKDLVGRELEFILQEMHREINTVGSKSSGILLSSLVLDMKTTLEKMWEQVHNVE
ncbi:MAG: YicC family protein [Atribacterota bacterium]|nr:YicC family protein [Atribacterota bacterium]